MLDFGVEAALHHGISNASFHPIVTRGVSHYGLAIYIKIYLKAKEELWKFKYFTMQKMQSSKKIL
jgi:hypothetical protein